MRHFFLVCIIALFLLLPLTSALAFVQSSNGIVSHPVRFQGGLPPSGTNCNITIYYQNNSILVDNKGMTNQGTYFNYTLNVNQTALIGKYPYDVTCVYSGINKTVSDLYYVNPGGIDPEQRITDVTSRSIYIILFIGFLFFICFLIFRENLTMRFTFILLTLLMIVIAINFLFISLQDEITSQTTQNFFSFFISVSYIMYWFIGFAIFAIWVVAIINTALQGKKDKRSQIYGEEL